MGPRPRRRAARAPDPEEPEAGATRAAARRAIAAAIVTALAWTLLAGAGGVGPPRLDWAKHNAVLCDLVERGRPVVYRDAAGRERALAFYVAYYLPAALAGKALRMDRGRGGARARVVRAPRGAAGVVGGGRSSRSSAERT